MKLQILLIFVWTMACHNHYLADWTVGCQEEPIHFEFHPSQSESLWRWSRCETLEKTWSVPDFRYFCIFWHQHRYVVFKPQVNESEQQRRSEIREIEEMLWGNPKSYPENQSIKSRRRKIGENKEIDRKSIQLRIDKQPLHWEVSRGNLKLRALKVLEKKNFANGKTPSLEASERES